VLEAREPTYRELSLIHDMRLQAHAPVHNPVCPRGANRLRNAQLGCNWETTWASGLVGEKPCDDAKTNPSQGH
jgi:hypothetical protein